MKSTAEEQSTNLVKTSPQRFRTRAIQIGDLMMGGNYPIVVQSMTTTDTMDIEKTVQQVKDLVEVGCQIVRITAPTVPDAEALKQIRDRLRADGYKVPLVADIHFVPAAAMTAADYVEKVRINPGNYADKKLFKTREYTDQEYNEEIQRIHDKFKPLVLKLKDLGRALRIGTNHGSLSDRIMNRYGDTPEGMVESAFEFADICRAYDFHNFCFSMKASNPAVMVRAYRLLVQRQLERGWDYPIHLGVTEAGDGEDGRIKSAIGIGTLLAEGIGDTIRVSLTESSVKEIPVAQAIAKRFPRTKAARARDYSRAELPAPKSKELPQVWLKFASVEKLLRELSETKLRPDILYLEAHEQISELSVLRSRISPAFGNLNTAFAVKKHESWWSADFLKKNILNAAKYIVVPNGEPIPSELLESGNWIRLANGISDLNALGSIDTEHTVASWSSQEEASLDRIIAASTELGSAFLELPFTGILLDGASAPEALSLSFGILQATRRRMSKTEYISCPSCGRTLFDLEETTARIKSVTSHLKGVKIAVMGCIVNGPGEMADADFGYVGGAPGRVNLYVGKDCVEKNIPSTEAPDRLVALIKTHGQWTEPAATTA